MREQLIEILGLSVDVADEQILSAVSEVKTAAAIQAEANAREKKTRSKIVESGGALTREQAIEVIEHQDGF